MAIPALILIRFLAAEYSAAEKKFSIARFRYVQCGGLREGHYPIALRTAMVALRRRLAAACPEHRSIMEKDLREKEWDLNASPAERRAAAAELDRRGWRV